MVWKHVAPPLHPGHWLACSRDKVASLSTLSPAPSPETGQRKKGVEFTHKIQDPELYRSVLYAGTKQSTVGNPPACSSGENPTLCLTPLSPSL